MVTPDAGSVRQSPSDVLSTAAGAKFISCCPEELVEVELEALRQGRECAQADGTRALRDAQAIAEAATAACERALVEQYVALDEARFRDVFTLAWRAGYHEVIAHLPRG